MFKSLIAPLAVSLVAMSALTVSAQRNRPASKMEDAADAWLATLTSEQKAKAQLPFNHEMRTVFHFVPAPPKPRVGVTLREMTDSQKKAAHQFLRTGLSESGYRKATGIMELDAVLFELENKNPIRDPERYFFVVFGDPSNEASWSWRVEGHHLSLNFTVAKGVVALTTPQFLGTNPAEVKSGPLQGSRVLKAEEDLGQEMYRALDESQRTAARLPALPGDIVTMAETKVNPLSPTGIPMSQMTEKQRELLRKVIGAWVNNVTDPVARERMQVIRRAGMDKIHFAYAGEMEKGKHHYYRVQGPTFLIEFDCVQGGNHIHSVWRDFNGDFGGDLLAEHYKAHKDDVAHGHSHDGTAHVQHHASDRP